MFETPQLARPDFSRADLKPELFDTAISQKGFKVKWEQGMFCSCYEPTGQPDYNCPACQGKGYIYLDGVMTKVLVTSINGHKDQERIGLNDIGTAYLTPLSTDDVGFRDRFTFVDAITKFSQVMHKDTTNILKYPAIDIIAMVRLGEKYLRGIHYDIRPGDNGSTEIVWGNTNLAQGEKVAVLYRTHPVYISINPVHELRGTYTMLKGGGREYYVPLPKQFQIKREDFIDNSALPTFQY